MTNETDIPVIMPHLTRADPFGYPRTVWIDNLYEDRHTDLLYWAPPDDPHITQSGLMVGLNEAQIRDLHAKLGALIAEFDGK